MIFVTGGTGLLGSHLLYALTSSGKRVRALKRVGQSVRNVQNTFSYYTTDVEKLLNRIEWVEGDVNDIYALFEAMDGVKQVYHCAALVSFDPNYEKAMWKTNVEGTTNMVNVALEKKVEKFCHVSSVAAIGKAKDSIDEETYWKLDNNTSNYSISKYSSEQEVWRASEEGLNVVIVNPSFIVGPGNWKSSSANTFNTVYKGLKYYTHGMTGFVDVRDVVNIMLQLTEHNVKAQRFLVTSENLTFKDFFTMAHELMSKPKPSINVSKFVSAIAWRTEKVRSSMMGYNPLITKETVSAAYQVSKFSNKKVKDLLNYNFIPVKESLKHTCEMYLRDKK